MTMECPLFNELRTSLIIPLYKILEIPHEAFDGTRAQVTRLLTDTNDSVTRSVAKFP